LRRIDHQVAEIFQKAWYIHGGRCNNKSKVAPASQQHAKETKENISMSSPLVCFVDHNNRVIGKSGAKHHFLHQEAVSAELHPRLCTGAMVMMRRETNKATNGTLALFICDSGCCRDDRE